MEARYVHSGQEGYSRDNNHEEGHPEVLSVWACNDTPTAAKAIQIDRFLVDSPWLALGRQVLAIVVGRRGFFRLPRFVICFGRHLDLSTTQEPPKRM